VSVCPGFTPTDAKITTDFCGWSEPYRPQYLSHLDRKETQNTHCRKSEQLQTSAEYLSPLFLNLMSNFEHTVES